MKPILKQTNLTYNIIFLVFLIPIFANANEMLSPSGFSVEPAISEVSVISDSQLKTGFSVRNTGKVPITFTVRVSDFEPGNISSSIKELDSSGDKYDPIMAAGWISVPAEPITVSPSQKIVVPYSISVPKDASPGGRSLVFVVESNSGNVHSRVNALCFLTVPGDAKENLILSDFSFNPLINSKAEGTFHIELKNTGKTHINPEGKIVIRNMFGVIRGEFPLTQSVSLGTIIPSAKRSTDYSWRGSLNAFDFGVWNAKVDLTYGLKGNHSMSERAIMLILPWKAILYTIFILGGAIYLFTFSVRKLKKKIIHLKENKIEIDESRVSIKLLIIPFITGLLLFIVAIMSLYSVLEYKGGGEFRKVDQNGLNK